MTTSKFGSTVMASVVMFALNSVGIARSQEARLTKVGACARTSIAIISDHYRNKLTRPKVNGEDNGVLVELINKITITSYSFNEEIFISKVGDPVLVCVVLIPTECPAGDTRGTFYTMTNLRTIKSWTLPNDTRECGGA